MLWAIGALICGAVALVAWGVLRPREDIIGRRLGLTRGSSGALPSETPFTQRVLLPFARRAGNALGRLLPQDALRRLDHMLVMAGRPAPTSVYLAFWAGLVLLTVLFGLYFISVAGEEARSPKLLVLGTLLLLMVSVSPYFLLTRRVRERQTQITKALPNALDLLVTCMEAGLGADAAIAKVREKTTGPLSELFTIYLRQVGLGRPRRDALTHIAEISGSAELLRLARSVVQAELVGASMGDVLRVQAADLRLARRHKAQQAAQRAPVLMTIPLVLCFMPAMAAVVMVPAILTMLNFIGNLGGG
ncbi:MAG TPA: type II secretion system F family protein [Dehalococcoidia bacterium]|nr:type II secretion system F family protein [Dehalococcoidia bacterium]